MNYDVFRQNAELFLGIELISFNKTNNSPCPPYTSNIPKRSLLQGRSVIICHGDAFYLFSKCSYESSHPDFMFVKIEPYNIKEMCPILSYQTLRH